MSYLRGRTGDSGKLLMQGHISDPWTVADDDWELHGQEGHSGMPGQLDFVESIEASQLQDETKLYRIDKPIQTDEAIAARTKLSGPVQFVLKLLDYWNLSRDDAVRLLGFEADDAKYVDRVLRGEEKLHGRDVKERIAHLIFIRSYLRSLFRDLETENEWLREEHSLLEGRKPLSMLLEGSFINVLDVRDYVDTVARR